MCRLSMLIGLGLVAGAVASAQEVAPDPIETRLNEKVAAYKIDLAKAKAKVVEVLTTKEQAAQRAGKLKEVEALREEIRSFEDTGEAPKSAPKAFKAYGAESRRVRNQLLGEYEAAVQAYTSNDQIEKAREVRAVADKLKEESAPRVDFVSPRPPRAEPVRAVAPKPVSTLPPQGNWHIRWRTADGAANEGMVRITGHELFPLKQAHVVGTAMIDGDGTLHLVFNRHPKVIGRAMATRQSKGVWAGRLQMSSGVYQFSLTAN